MTITRTMIDADLPLSDLDQQLRYVTCIHELGQPISVFGVFDDRDTFVSHGRDLLASLGCLFKNVVTRPEGCGDDEQAVYKYGDKVVYYVDHEMPDDDTVRALIAVYFAEPDDPKGETIAHYLFVEWNMTKGRWGYSFPSADTPGKVPALVDDSSSGWLTLNEALGIFLDRG